MTFKAFLTCQANRKFYLQPFLIPLLNKSSTILTMNYTMKTLPTFCPKQSLGPLKKNTTIQQTWWSVKIKVKLNKIQIICLNLLWRKPKNNALATPLWSLDIKEKSQSNCLGRPILLKTYLQHSKKLIFNILLKNVQL